QARLDAGPLQRDPGVRLREGGRGVLPGAGVHPRARPRADDRALARAAAAAAERRHRPLRDGADPAGAGVRPLEAGRPRAPAGDRPPRRLPQQRPYLGARRGEAVRLRHRQGRRAGHQDAARGGEGERQLHVPRTGARQQRRRARRPLLPRPGHVLLPDGRGALPRRNDLRAAGQGRQRPRARGARAHRRPPRPLRRDRPPGAGDRPGQALSNRRRVRRRAGPAHGGRRRRRRGDDRGAVRRRLPRRRGPLRGGAAKGRRWNGRRGRRPESAGVINPSASPAARPPLLIVQIGPPEPLDRAPAAYRTIQPCRALGELPDLTVVSGSILSPALFGAPGRGASEEATEGAKPSLLLDADVLVVREVADPDLLPIIAARRRNGRLTIYEIGSHLFAHPPAAVEGAPAVDADLVARSLPPQLARQADGLQLATRALEAEFAGLNPRRAVFESQLWEPAATTAAARAPDRLVIGWAGTRSERGDLALALPALAGVLDRHPEVRVAVMGDPELQGALAPLPAARTAFIPAGSFERAQRFLDEIDIGIAPLCPTAFNRCRDDVRFLEYASHGVLAICADLEPYRDVVRPGQTGFLFRDPAELETVLERVLAEKELRAAIPGRAARTIADRLERPRATNRLGFYLSVAAQMGIRLGHGGDARAPFPAPELTEPSVAGRLYPGAHYLALGASKVERLLGEGWSRRAAGETAVACRAFDEAERMLPDSHLPPLLLGMTAEDEGVALAALVRAEARNPL